MDCIELKNLRISTIIGTRPEERHTPQELIFSLWIYSDFVPAAQSDNLPDAVNYVEVVERIQNYCKDTQFYLLETLLEKCAELILAIPLVQRVKLRVEKPQAMPPIEVALEIERSLV